MSTSTLSDEVRARQKELFDRGYTQVEKFDKRQGDFNRLVDLANKKYGADHKYMQHHFIVVPETVISHAMSFVRTMHEGLEVTQRVDTPIAVNGLWCPEWMLAIVAYERDWRRDANRGIAQAYDHDEIVDVLHKGLLGDMETVDAFMCLKELAIEGKRAAMGWVIPSQNPCGEILAGYMTLNETRCMLGLPELPE